MAVTTEYTTQATDLAAGKKKYAADLEASLILIPFDFTQGVAAGDIGSFVRLYKDNIPTIPAGRYWFHGLLSHFTCDAFGAARTLDFGWNAYTEPDGDAVAADDNGLDDDVDVSSALTGSTLGSDLAAGTGRRKLFESKNGVELVFTVAGGTIPAGTKINGHLVLTRA